MVKTTDAAFAEEIGVETYPALVFFKEGVPNLYEGDLTIEEEVLDWLIEMKVESHIELITRPMLETMVVEVQYLAVFFYKQNCRTCDQIIAELENIDDECDQYGVQMVKLKDPPLAKRLIVYLFNSYVFFFLEGMGSRLSLLLSTSATATLLHLTVGFVISKIFSQSLLQAISNLRIPSLNG